MLIINQDPCSKSKEIEIETLDSTKKHIIYLSNIINLSSAKPKYQLSILMLLFHFQTTIDKNILTFYSCSIL